MDNGSQIGGSLSLEHGETKKIDNAVNYCRSCFNDLSYNAKTAFFLTFVKEFNREMKEHRPKEQAKNPSSGIWEKSK